MLRHWQTLTSLCLLIIRSSMRLIGSVPERPHCAHKEPRRLSQLKLRSFRRVLHLVGAVETTRGGCCCHNRPFHHPSRAQSCYTHIFALMDTFSLPGHFPPVTHLTSQTKMNLGLNPWWAHFIADPRSRLSKGCGEKFQNESFFSGGSPARYVLAMDERCACRVNTRGKKTAQRSGIQISHIDAPRSLQILPIFPQKQRLCSIFRSPGFPPQQSGPLSSMISPWHARTHAKRTALPHLKR